MAANELKSYEVKAFRNYCVAHGYFVVSEGPKQFVFIAGKHGKQVLPIKEATLPVPGARGKGGVR